MLTAYQHGPMHWFQDNIHLNTQNINTLIVLKINTFEITAEENMVNDI